MIWLALFTAYCLACALWSLTERRERQELRRRLEAIRRRKS